MSSARCFAAIDVEVRCGHHHMTLQCRHAHTCAPHGGSRSCRCGTCPWDSDYTPSRLCLSPVRPYPPSTPSCGFFFLAWFSLLFCYRSRALLIVQPFGLSFTAECGSTLAEMWPTVNSAEFGRNVGNCGLSFDQHQPRGLGLDLIWVDFDRIRAEVQFRPNSAQARQTWPELDQDRPRLSQTWPKLAMRRPNLER